MEDASQIKEFSGFRTDYLVKSSPPQNPDGFGWGVDNSIFLCYIIINPMQVFSKR